MRISVVTTMYLSGLYIEEFYNRIKESIEKIKCEYEIIIVNDGSPDNSLDIAINISKQDKNVIVVDLSRNFGHHKAILQGLKYSNGDFVFYMDCDLEEDPELIIPLYQEIRKHEGSADVIYGVQKQRNGNWFRRWAGSTYYSIFNLLSETKIPKNLSLTRIMTKRYIESLLLHQESNIVMAGLFQITGYNQIPFVVDKRYKGKTSYSVLRRISLLLDSISSFSVRPLIFISMFGFFITMVAFLYSIYLVIRKVGGLTVDGWTSIMVSIWFFSGLIILFIGIVGLYVAKIYIETKNRPIAIIKDVYNFSDKIN